MKMLLNLVAVIEFPFFAYSQSSNLFNKARLDVLKAQEKHCKDILEEARARLQGKGSDPVILEKLITQALFQVSKIVFECS